MMRSPWDNLKRVAMWLISGFSILFGYALAKLEPFREAVELPLSPIDQAIPLIPWTIWIYGSGTFMCLVAWFFVPDGRSARRLYFTLLMSAMICWVFFFFFPTTYPRHLWPLPAGASSTLLEFADLRASDSPSNCFPSQHVALAWSLALCWIDWTKRKGVAPFILLWAGLVSLTTLTTKQHYLVDIPAGFFAGAVSWWVVRSQIRDRARHVGLHVKDARDQAVLTGLLSKVRAHQWSLDDLPWPTERQPPLAPEMVKLLSHTIWIEEIAGLNFRLLERASEQSALCEIYHLFAEEERRHANGLRRLLALHGAAVEPPGLGTSLVLDQFDTLEADALADVALVITATPVFETFLDAGTIPFLQQHPSLKSPLMDRLVERIDHDEGAHLAVNWMMSKAISRENRGWKSLLFLLNPNIPRGGLAVPALGFSFSSLLPAFYRLGGLHRRSPELAWSPLWWLFRLFVLCGTIATLVTHQLARSGLLFIRFWLLFTSITDHVGRRLFGPSLLERRGLELNLPATDASLRRPTKDG